MTNALGVVAIIFFRHFDFESTIGNKITDAPKNRNSMREMGLILVAKYFDAIKDPATNVEAINVNM